MESTEEKKKPRRRGRKQNSRPKRQPEEKSKKVEDLIRRIKEELADSTEPICLHDLTAFERRLIHQQFGKSSEYVTKTYRLSEEDYELRIYPVGNLRRYAQKMADQAVQTREKVILPPMSAYERFVVHDYLKNLDTIKTISRGEGEDRHIEIEPEVFGRNLKRIIRKIKLF